MTFRFDKEFSRTGTHSIKWEFIHDGTQLRRSDQSDAKHGENRLLPMWVADMDFRCPLPDIPHGPLGRRDAENAIDSGDNRTYAYIGHHVVIDSHERIWAHGIRGVSVFSEA